MKKILLILMMFPVLASSTMLGTRPLLRGAAQNQVKFDSTVSDTNKCTNAIWNEFINRACIQVAEETDCVRKTLAFLCTTGVETYEVDTALLDIQSVIKNVSLTSRPLIHVPASAARQITQDTALSTNQSPKVYWVEGDSIHFYPTPNNSVDSFVIGYSIYPAYLNYDKDSASGAYVTSTNIPLEYREAIVLYACYQFLARIKDYSGAEWWLKQYNLRVGKHQKKDSQVYDLPKGGG